MNSKHAGAPTEPDDSVKKIGGRWVTRIRLPNGQRRRFRFDGSLTPEQARKAAREARERIRTAPVDQLVIAPAKRGNPGQKTGGPTVREYASTWAAVRKARGIRGAESDTLARPAPNRRAAGGRGQGGGDGGGRGIDRCSSCSMACITWAVFDLWLTALPQSA